MNVFILDDYQQAVTRLDCFKLLDGFDVTVLTETEKDPEKLSQKIQQAEVLVLIRERTEITEALLSRLSNLKLISQTGKISNHLDLNACTKHKVAVAEGIGSPIAPAELTWILIMNALRKIPQAIEAMKKGEWQTNIGTMVYGKKIGIWGYGKIGKRIAGYAKAFGAEVVIWGSESSRRNAIADGFAAAQSKQEFFSGCDVVSLHLRLNPETSGIVKSSDLELMKTTAALINTARAELIEPGALLHGLKNGRPGFAGIDVYESEPLYDIENPLLKMPNVVCTPHLGYVEQNGYELYFSKAFENVVAFADGNPVNIANPEVI
ncbi:D-2-hydroxyacid dehydrogenase family protein [Flavobacterium sp. MAH-1]|uniref:D-2-hydroxyacid dehydrogenase family protein n=1 Tax=Flavobacterium agri TaxID=2743471 RepID=A0A7Y8XZG1_9FLAO|nr:D-2-hydroxyacid dehydrogenase family protein [Flavobacterium agri]NUY79749.1 D-2-hydroxyacid dehydrogenase family protein [Flavobacterium agri]NYA69774.1 D-2-hydroxyacid dehydrogenase family protein [Flavobacterium agri]